MSETVINLHSRQRMRKRELGDLNFYRILTFQMCHRWCNSTLCQWQTLKKPAPETGTRKTGNGFWYVWHAILHRFFLVSDSGIG